MAQWSERVLENGVVAMRLMGEGIVLYRAGGKVAALGDTCPHRLAPLSLGKVCDGHLRCGYHGLEFDASGACVRNPHGSGKIPAAAKVRSYPVHERYSVVWIWMGEPAAADPATIPEFAMLDEDAANPVLRRGYIQLAANYELVVENLLDLSHSCYLHDGVLGHEGMAQAQQSVEQIGERVLVRRIMHDVAPPALFDLNYRRDGRNVDIWGDTRWDKPACLLVDTGVVEPGRPRQEGSGVLGTHFLTPADERTTHYFFAAVRSNPVSWGEPIDSEIRERAAALQLHAFEEQDEMMLEAQQRQLDELGPNRPRPVMLETDIGLVRFQRVLRELRESEQGGAVEPPQRVAAA